MTSQPEPGPHTGTQASRLTAPLREPAALALVAADALLLFASLVDLLAPVGDFTGRAAGVFFTVAGLTGVLLPLAAVLLATHLAPPVRRAGLVTQVALAEYAASAVLAVVATLGWLGGSLADGEVRLAFTGLLTRLAHLGLLAVAGYVVFTVWRGLYRTPRPKREPGVYGRPQPQAYGQPTAPGTPGVYGQPTATPPGFPSTGTAFPATSPAQPGPTAFPPTPPAPASTPSADTTRIASYNLPSAGAPPAPVSPPQATPPAPTAPVVSAEATQITSQPAASSDATQVTSHPAGPSPVPPDATQIASYNLPSAGAPPTPVSPPAPTPAADPAEVPAPQSAPPAPRTAPGSEATQVIPPAAGGGEATQMIVPASRRPETPQGDQN